MKTFKLVAAALAMVSCTACFAQGVGSLGLLALSGQAKQQTPEEAAVAALQKEFFAAMMEYQKPLIEAKNAEERALVKLDPAQNPAHQYYPRFRELAVKYGKTGAAFTAWTLALQTAMQTQNTAGVEEIQALMLKDFINTPEFAAYVPRLTTARTTAMTPEEYSAKLETVLLRVERESTNPEVIAAALARRANLYPQDTTRVADLNRQLLAKYPGTTAGKRAKAAIYEAENLVVGKMAPDFEAEDIDGKKFKLSDYRGKVVVMEFWGFW